MKDVTEYNDRAAKNPLILAHIVKTMSAEEKKELYILAVLHDILPNEKLVEERIQKELK